MIKKLTLLILTIFIQIYAFSENILSIPFIINNRNRIEVHTYIEGEPRSLELGFGTFPTIFLKDVKQKSFFNDDSEGTFNISERIVKAKLFYTTEFKFAENENIKLGILFINLDEQSNFFSNDGLLGLSTFSVQKSPVEINFSNNRINLLDSIPKDYEQSYPFLLEHNALFVILSRNGNNYRMKICTEMDTDMIFPPINGNYGFIGINAMKNYDTVFDFKNNVIWFKNIK